MAKNRESTRYKSNLQERRIASRFDEFGGKQVIGSGSTPFLKGDVITEDFLIECKTKKEESTQITVKKEWIEKANEQAYQMRKQYAILALSFGDDKDYYLMEPQLFEYLYQKAKALDKVWELMNTPGLRCEGLEDALCEAIQDSGLYLE